MTKDYARITDEPHKIGDCQGRSFVVFDAGNCRVTINGENPEELARSLIERFNGAAAEALRQADCDRFTAVRDTIVEARRVWLEENDPQDGTDCVTPFDKFLYGRSFVKSDKKRDVTDADRSKFAGGEFDRSAADTVGHMAVAEIVDDLVSVTIEHGKYTIRQTAPGKWECLRNGEPWPAFEQNGPDNLHVALAYEVDNLRRQVAAMSAPEGTFAWALHLMLWEQKSAYRESHPHIKFDFDGAEGCAFWSMNEETDDLLRHAFTVDEILAQDWKVGE
ncbi:hypothetical protein [Sinorhizobium meliloti]|uniref:hypothetical protein n=1 Tax=Rhizobium meliloti TaxID=382 RepID=UPI0001E4B032|nr:hypothetical protein [Sinorhizobium meliloti]AEG53176.1 hypothetical protein Sinme_1431 [Sinorhizobium meliloti AK83]MDE4591108.1 hypothetical protein [Sinorhizobium meliloti]SEI56598.1 hypothetical protein SAMN04244575_01080 [Sinorhizobium meliloti]